MNNSFLHIVRVKGISNENGIDYDEYIELSDSVIEIIEKGRPEVLDELLGMITYVISDHISSFLEDLCENLETDLYVNIIKKHLFTDNRWRLRAVLDLVEICSREEFLDLLNTDEILKSQYTSLYVDSLVDLHSEYKSDVGKELLIRAYNSDINVRTKYNIRQLLKKKYNVDLPKYEGFIDYQHDIAMKMLPSITESARLDFKNKKYHSVIRSLNKYKKEDLPPLGQKLLSLAIKQNGGTKVS